MNIFIRRLILFSIPLLIGIGLIEWKLSEIPNTYNQKKRYFERQLDSIEVLVLGSSQTVDGINPQFFSHHGFNLANISQTFYYDSALTSKYISKLPNLKLVIIPVSYFSFYSNLFEPQAVEQWRCYFYKRFWDIDYQKLPKLDFKNYSLIALYTPMQVIQFAKRGFKVNESEGLLANGFFKRDTTDNYKNISDSLGIERVKYHDSIIIRNIKEFEASRNELEKMIKEYKEKNIEVALITTPVFPTYSKYCNDTILDKNQKTINYLCKKYNCKYFDYFDDRRFGVRDFLNNDHLNFIGAAYFSEIIDHDVIQPTFNKWLTNYKS